MKYKKIIAHHPGGPEVLQLVAEDLPQAKGKNVRIKIQASGVAFADVLIREGVYPGRPKFPLTPGYDIVGIAESVGGEVQNIKAGQRVAALTIVGGYAEYILLPESELVIVPNELDAAEAVSLVLNYVTAYQMLHREVPLKQGDAIVIHGAAGGVGSALLQLGRLMGLKMYGTASKGKHELIKSLGAYPIDYKNEEVEKIIHSAEPKGLAAAYDATGEWLAASYRLLRKNGALVVFGASSMLEKGRKSILKTIATYFRFSIFLKKFLPGKKKISFYTVTKYKKLHPEWFKEDLLKLFSMLARHEIKPVIAYRKTLEEAANCHELLNNAAITGKIVISH